MTLKIIVKDVEIQVPIEIERVKNCGQLFFQVYCRSPAIFVVTKKDLSAALIEIKEKIEKYFLIVLE